MELYKNYNQCYGCGACEQACDHNAIIMKEDEEGFLYPVIDDELCVQCGKCVQKCQISMHMNDTHVNAKKTPQVIAVRNRDESVRAKSSSGGVFYSLASYIITHGGVVFGAVFDSEFEVEHIGACEECDIKKMMGSKYVQSRVKHTYKEVKNHLENDKIVMYTGTPCQISGLRSYLGTANTDKLISVSIVCHGVGSPMIWRRYLKLKKGQYAQDTIKEITFRDKKNGWRNYDIRMSFGDVDYRKCFIDDLYMKAYVQNLYLRPSCYTCKAKQRLDGSDLIIGDFWGIENCLPELDDDKGTGCLVLNSLKGQRLWEKVENQFLASETSYDMILKYNSMINSSGLMNPNREKFYAELRDTCLLEESIMNHLNRESISEMERQVIQYPIVYRHLNNRIKGKSLADFMVGIGWKTVVLYAFTDLMEIAYQDIVCSDTGVVIESICDKAFAKYSNPYKGVPIVGIAHLKEMLDNGKVDGVVICNPLRENSIYKDLLKHDIPFEKIISVISAIFD